MSSYDAELCKSIYVCFGCNLNSGKFLEIVRIYHLKNVPQSIYVLKCVILKTIIFPVSNKISTGETIICLRIAFEAKNKTT